MTFRRWMSLLILLLAVYLGYHWWLLSRAHADLQEAIPPVVLQYAEMQKKYVVPLLERNATTSEGQALKEITTHFAELEQKKGIDQVHQLMDLQKKSFTLFDGSGSVLTTQAEFSLWRHESSQNSVTFQKIVAYNQKAKVFNGVLSKPLINIIGLLRGMKAFPLIDVNGSIYHEAITI